MPLQYSSIITEHQIVRSSAGVFDVSHLGKLRVRGAAASRSLQRALTADVEAVPVGSAAYSVVLADDGGCIDDVFVYRHGDRDWLVVPNAANTAAVSDAIASAGGAVVDEWDRWAILAVQGPRSFEVFGSAFPGSGATGLKRHQLTELNIAGVPGFVARTGYTGERGFELYAPAETAAEGFERLLRHGAEPAGLGARDTLRLEMGYALYGHELTRDINPLEAGLGWTLAWSTPFRGRDALAEITSSGGPTRALFGIACSGRGVPRRGHAVRHDDADIAVVTSGNFSPVLRAGVALALGDRARVPPPGTEVEIEGRGRTIDGSIVTPPFVDLRRSRGEDKST